MYPILRKVMQMARTIRKAILQGEEKDRILFSGDAMKEVKPYVLMFENRDRAAPPRHYVVFTDLQTVRDDVLDMLSNEIVNYGNIGDKLREMFRHMRSINVLVSSKKKDAEEIVPKKEYPDAKEYTFKVRDNPDQRLIMGS